VFTIGGEAKIPEHHKLLKRFSGKAHDELNSVSGKVDESGHVIWQFSYAGKFRVACLRPGHYEAGTRGDVVVMAQYCHRTSNLKTLSVAMPCQ